MWRYVDGEQEILLCLYVDDILCAVSDKIVYERFFSFLKSRYPIGEANAVKEFLSVNIDQDLERDTTTIHQSVYIEKLLTKFSTYRSLRTHSAPLPMNLRECFSQNQVWCDEKFHSLYREIVGSLLYLSTWTRPDIAYAVSLLSRFLQQPSELHLSLAFHVLGYLKRYPFYGLIYSRFANLQQLDSIQQSALQVNGLLITPDEEYDHEHVEENSDHVLLQGYADATWNDSPSDRKSTSGYILLAGTTAVSWGSKRQPIIALSTAESEFISATRCAQEACFLRMMFEFLGFPQQEATVIFEDNKACVQMAQNPANASRTKHIDLREFYLKELERRNLVRLVHVSTNEQHADFLTKSLSHEKHRAHHRFVCGYPLCDPL